MHRTETWETGQYIRNLIASGENQNLDFKFEISNARKMAKTFSAFANTGGGRLLIGVKDNGKIAGVKSEEEAYMAESAAHIFCRPAVVFRIKKWILEGKTVLEVEIPESHSRPHYAKDEKGEWIAYVRVNDQNIQANRVLVAVWKNERKRKGRLLNYGREEKVLLDYLREHGRITLQGFMRIARINRTDAEKLLVDLILMNVVAIEVSEKLTSFHMKQNPSLSV